MHNIFAKGGSLAHKKLQCCFFETNLSSLIPMKKKEKKVVKFKNTRCNDKICPKKQCIGRFVPLGGVFMAEKNNWSWMNIL